MHEVLIDPGQLFPQHVVERLEHSGVAFHVSSSSVNGFPSRRTGRLRFRNHSPTWSFLKDEYPRGRSENHRCEAGARLPPRNCRRREAGDVWTWTALDVDSKLIVSYLVGGRGGEYAKIFMRDLASRLEGRVELTTDAHIPYQAAVEEAFSGHVDYGTTEMEGISNSFVERQNLTMRMSMKRFARQTNAHSKKFENHIHLVSLYFLHYQLLPHPSDDPLHAGHGSGDHRHALRHGVAGPDDRRVRLNLTAPPSPDTLNDKSRSEGRLPTLGGLRHL